jgi:hypothetical protein
MNEQVQKRRLIAAAKAKLLPEELKALEQEISSCL